MKHTIKINSNDITSTDEYDVHPDYVTFTYGEDLRSELEAAHAALHERSSFHSIEVAANAFDWDTDEGYEGKARGGYLKIIKATDLFYYYLTFRNDWTGTQYECDISDDLNKFMGAL